MISSPQRFLILYLFIHLLCLQACQSVTNETSIKRVLLISVDTLRPDYLGCYGAKNKNTPNIDEFASENVLFTQVTSQAPSTAISHKSILYSLYPSIHKTSSKIVPEERLTSPLQIIRENGFKTAAFVGGGELSHKFGFAKGFDSYWEAGTYSDTDSAESLEMLEKRVVSWLEMNKEENFFLFLHTYELHCPYYPPTEYRNRFAGWYNGEIDPRRKCGDTYYNLRQLSGEDIQFIRDLYSAQVAYLDDFIGRLFSKLKALNLYQDTLIIFLSDHGESLADRGYVGHNQLYQKQLRIPLILRIPGFSNLKIDSPVESVDVMPTIFQLLKLKKPYSFQGQNLMPYILNPEKGRHGRVLFSEQSGKIRVQKDKMVAVFALKQTNSTEIYELQNDPFETNNVAWKHKYFIYFSEMNYLLMLNRGREAASRFVVGKNSNPILDLELTDELKALGYIR